MLHNYFISISLLSFFVIIFIVSILLWWLSHEIEEKVADKIKRHTKNPVMSPQAWNEWENSGTFNPAAIIDKNGRVHILYRAIGSDGISRIGYASSKDGLHFDERLSYPVFLMQNPRQNIPQEKERRFDPILYASGGSWGGTEDPRLVEIDGKIYMTFNAFDGWDYIRIAVTSINSKDFYNKRWHWKKPLFLSPRGQVNKNWLIFPEKINGKFAILHSMTPTVQIDYVDRLEDLHLEKVKIKSHFGSKVPRESWDTWVRGAGPPPIKTRHGWLVLYHAMDKRDPHIGYKLGAMLLDLNNPRKIIARSPSPLLTPNEWYENDWKPGVVYACGAAVRDGTLYVYYGGGDKHVCIAHTELDQLLNWLIKEGKNNLA